MNKFEPILEEEMCCFVAPDGTPQPMSLAPDKAMSIALMEMLSSKGISEPVGKLIQAGWEVYPVKLTITQNGTPEDAFKKMKSKL